MMAKLKPHGISTSSFFKLIFVELTGSLWFNFTSWKSHLSIIKKIVLFFPERLVMAAIMLVTAIITTMFSKTQVFGRNNVPQSGRTLVLARHRSYLGTFIIGVYLFFPWIFIRPQMYPVNIAKLKHIDSFAGKKLGWVVRRIAAHVGVHGLEDSKLGKQRMAIVQLELDCLNNPNGGSLVLFPTGTRDHPGVETLGRFSSGVGRIVAETLPTIIFVWDNDTRKIKLRRPFLKRPEVHLFVSKPFDTASSKHISTMIKEHGLNCIGDSLAEYLRKLMWAWAVTQDNALEQYEKTDSVVTADLLKII